MVSKVKIPGSAYTYHMVMEFQQGSLLGLVYSCGPTCPSNHIPGLDVGSPGSPSKMAQWSKMHCGKACPLVPDLRAAVKPKDSFTGRYARTRNIGVPGAEREV